MVRLRVAYVILCAGIHVLFQFLYGAIKGYPCGNHRTRIILFQFLYGAIKDLIGLYIIS